MKRVFTIILLFLFLLNVLGLYGVLLGLKARNAKLVNDRLDHELFDESEVLTFKVALSLPYSTGNEDYQRVTGDFIHQGEVFRLIKQRLCKDTLYVVCFKDRTEKAINEAMSDYVKTFADKPVDAKQQTGKTEIHSFSKDYLLSTVQESPSASGWMNDARRAGQLTHFLSAHFGDIDYPPRILS